MGYFPNGTSGMFYEDEFCANCVHGKDPDSMCPVMVAHHLYNYDQLDADGEAKGPLATVLSLLIPQSKDGLGNEQCALFVAKGDDRLDADAAYWAAPFPKPREFCA